jgi:hypothetical protein
MAKRCSKRRGARMHRRTRRGGRWRTVAMEGQGMDGGWVNPMEGGGGGRKKVTRNNRRTRRGGVTWVGKNLGGMEGGQGGVMLRAQMGGGWGGGDGGSGTEMSQYFQGVVKK